MEMLSNHIVANICTVAIGLTPNQIFIQWTMSNIPRSIVFWIAIWWKCTEHHWMQLPMYFIWANSCGGHLMANSFNWRTRAWAPARAPARARVRDFPLKAKPRAKQRNFPLKARTIFEISLFETAQNNSISPWKRVQCWDFPFERSSLRSGNFTKQRFQAQR